VSTNGQGDSGGLAFRVTPGEASQIALTPEEQALVTKLLGDPTYFPIEFRRWLEDFIGNSDIKISQSQIIGGGAGGGSSNPSLLPAGIILPYATTTIGKDCLLCNGAAISRTDYKELFDAIGTAWGSGDGTTTFTLPDLRDRALYGVGSVLSLASTDGKSLGNRGGPSHHHSVNGNTSQNGAHNHNLGSVGDHSHSISPAVITGTVQNALNSADNPAVTGSGTVSGTGGAGGHSHSVGSVNDHSHGINLGTSGGYDADKPSYAGVQYAITTGRSATS
jgi:microcystin-dependent protein